MYDEKDIHRENDNENTATDSVTDASREANGGEVCFFGGDISFDTPEEYDDTPDKLKTLKSVFSMTHFSLFVYLMVSQGIATVIALLSMLFLASAGSSVLVNGDFTLMLNIVAQYVIAFPLFVLLTKGIRKRESVSKKRLSAPSFLLILLICEGVMLLGAIISNLLTYLIEKALGGNYGSAVDGMISDSSLWLVFLTVCVFAPIFEELMFRKIMIDRLSLFGDGAAIIFSAVAFGFFHGNLAQIVYATAVGLILGYVYARTRRIGYTVALHSILNFLGGILPTGVEWLMNEIERMKALGGAADTGRLHLYEVLVSAYDALQLLFVVGAVAALVVLIIKKKISVDKEREIEIETGTVVKAGMANAGFVLLYAVCALLIVISLVAV